MSLAPRADNGKVTVPDILSRKSHSPAGFVDSKSKITCLTAYDYPTARLLDEAGVDILLVETVFDSLNSKAALFAIARLFEDVGCRIPVMLSFTITDLSGRTLSGQTVEAYWNAVSHFPLLRNFTAETL